ncbi:uncharacterized protein BXZ73DRAFT_50957 [Epithele typhae]|uniref:uncharacterized protein n=1 Tax=Epithele typhae TaxID=378194 RepID=UPI0020073B0D|nr:uncharacterized protein BXZ73DRAFT_50957 [Epithele typhae]KAH9923444.1 hypothetical protein BXZ73DRAFT_50957 [Epithele typhae]
MPPSYSPCPRPCLKRSSRPPNLLPPQDEQSALLAIDPSILSSVVRFPPQTALTHTLGEAVVYDRTPIKVQPNNCALPARGCPGRTYVEDPNAPRPSKRTGLSPQRGKTLHPRAVDSRDRRYDDDPTPRQSPRVDYHPLPALVPDLSSESSEESDGMASPPSEHYSLGAAYNGPKFSLEHSLMSLTMAGTNAPSTSALSFLPHPPTPKMRSPHSPAGSPSHSPSNSQCYAPGYSNPHSTRTTSPVRSLSPHSRRKSRSGPSVPVPIGAAYPSTSPSHMPTSPSVGLPASPERERRSRHRDDRGRENRDRSRERKDRERAEKLKKFNERRTLGFDDASCLGGF